MPNILGASSSAIEFYGMIAVLASGFLALSAALRLLWKKIIVPLARIDGALPTLVKIADEFKENGGNSLKDRINKIEDQQEKIDQRIDAIDRKIQDLEIQSERLNRYIDIYLSNRQTLGPRTPDDWFRGMGLGNKELEF